MPLLAAAAATPATKKKNRDWHVRAPEEVDNRLTQIATVRRMEKSEVIRKAVEYYVHVVDAGGAEADLPDPPPPVQRSLFER